MSAVQTLQDTIAGAAEGVGPSVVIRGAAMATRVAAPKPSPIFAQIPFGCGGCVGTGPLDDASEPGPPAGDAFRLGSFRDAIATSNSLPPAPTETTRVPLFLATRAPHPVAELTPFCATLTSQGGQSDKALLRTPHRRALTSGARG